MAWRMGELYYIIGISCLAIVIESAITPKVKWLWYYKIFTQSKNSIRNIPSWKPFECASCMGWWMGLAYFFLTGESFILSILYSAICYVLSTIINNVIRRTV